MTVQDQLDLAFQEVGSRIKGVISALAGKVVALPVGDTTPQPNGTLIVRTGGVQPVNAPVYTSFVPPLGYSVASPDYFSGGTTAYTSGTINRQYMRTYTVRAAWACAGPTLNVATAASGGAGLVLRVGLYGSTADGYPDTSNLLRSASLTDFTTGNKQMTWDQGEFTFQPGVQYWYGVTFTYTTAPSTFPALTCINNGLAHLPLNGGPSVSVVRGLYVAAASGALRTTALAPTGWSTSSNNDVPVVWMRRSATN